MEERRRKERDIILKQRKRQKENRERKEERERFARLLKSDQISLTLKIYNHAQRDNKREIDRKREEGNKHYNSNNPMSFYLIS